MEIGSLSGSGPLKPTLLVLNAPHGPDRYHWLVPQSTRPLGYWPLSTRFGLARSSKVSVRVVLLSGVAVAVAVGAVDGATARAAFNRPYVQKVPVPAIGSAVLNSRSRTAAGLVP